MSAACSKRRVGHTEPAAAHHAPSRLQLVLLWTRKSQAELCASLQGFSLARPPLQLACQSVLLAGLTFLGPENLRFIRGSCPAPHNTSHGVTAPTAAMTGFARHSSRV